MHLVNWQQPLKTSLVLHDVIVFWWTSDNHGGESSNKISESLFDYTVPTHMPTHSVVIAACQACLHHNKHPISVDLRGGCGRQPEVQHVKEGSCLLATTLPVPRALYKQRKMLLDVIEHTVNPKWISPSLIPPPTGSSWGTAALDQQYSQITNKLLCHMGPSPDCRGNL